MGGRSTARPAVWYALKDSLRLEGQRGGCVRQPDSGMVSRLFVKVIWRVKNCYVLFFVFSFFNKLCFTSKIINMLCY